MQKAYYGYYAMVGEVDYHVRRILEAVPENTIVIYTSDHGEWHGRYDKEYPGDDAVTRVPLLVRLPSGETGIRSTIVEAVDVVTTLLEVCGIPVSPHLQVRRATRSA